MTAAPPPPNARTRSTRIAFIGAGNIAEIHATAVRDIPGLQFVAVVDPNAARTKSFARKWQIDNLFDSVDALIAAKTVTVAHVLVPPPLHRSVAEPLLRAGIHVLLEKPMAQDGVECAALQDAAAAGGAMLRVNHNCVYHPAHRAAKRMLTENRIGPIRHVECRFNLPLRQLGARQLGHWMFDRPLNLLLEQAVHPLSQIDDFVGPVRNLTVLAPRPLKIGAAQEILRTFLVALECERGTAQLLLSLGENYPHWGTTIIGEDGAIFADYHKNRTTYEADGRWMDAFDNVRDGTQLGLALQRQSLTNAANAIAATLKLRQRADWFYQSMMGSIGSFYRDLDQYDGDATGADGRRMVELCERIIRAANLPDRKAVVVPKSDGSGRPHDVLVIGGTGFIGQHVVSHLLRRDHRVGVLARSVRNLPGLYADPRVRVIQGDARNADDVARAIGEAKLVVNLAHGGGGASRAETEANLVGAAKTVAECCLALSVRRLVYVSSIASLYLGDANEVVTGTTPPDPEFESRGDYARAKAISEHLMLEFHRGRGLPVLILRPGVVIGEGGTTFHSGLGFYNHESHCLGWNRGLDPLPLVLVDDVAEAVLLAMNAKDVEGKCYNVVGDIRLNARQYIDTLARATGRPLRYHPQSVLKLYGIELIKFSIKRATGRRDPWPSLRDLKSRGMVARFDCNDTMRDLGWRPVSDWDEFLRKGFRVYGGTD